MVIDYIFVKVGIKVLKLFDMYNFVQCVIIGFNLLFFVFGSKDLFKIENVFISEV